jgi:hypothetical protein
MYKTPNETPLKLVRFCESFVLAQIQKLISRDLNENRIYTIYIRIVIQASSHMASAENPVDNCVMQNVNGRAKVIQCESAVSPARMFF